MEVLEKLKRMFSAISIEQFDPITKVYRKLLFNKLMKSKTLLEWMQECDRLNQQNIYYIDIEDDLTNPYIGLTKEELYTMGLDNEKVDKLYQLNRELGFLLYTIKEKNTDS